MTESIRQRCPSGTRYSLCLIAFLGVSTLAVAEEGAWKTAFVKRGFVGAADAAWVGGTGATLRMRTPLQFGGTKVRVFVRGAFEHGVELTTMALLKGADEQGLITGLPVQILFQNSQQLKIEKGLKSAVSDEIQAQVTPGTWYVDDRYASARFPYAYEVDQGFYEAGDAVGKERLLKSVKFRSGILYRIDVFTTDPRASILCYGDSITHGYSSTPNADQRYPAILGKLLDRPVLNMGQNGDMVTQAMTVPGTVKDLPGVDTVIFLMGINDIVSGGRIKSARDYAEVVKQVISGCRSLNKKIYIGTISAAEGCPAFDKDPSKEKLRQELNAWIAGGNGATGVIDFAAAIADPEHPSKLKADCQSDWLHPNDLGYRKMAETAAKALSAK